MWVVFCRFCLWGVLFGPWFSCFFGIMLGWHTSATTRRPAWQCLQALPASAATYSQRTRGPTMCAGTRTAASTRVGRGVLGPVLGLQAQPPLLGLLQAAGLVCIHAPQCAAVDAGAKCECGHTFPKALARYHVCIHKRSGAHRSKTARPRPPAAAACWLTLSRVCPLRPVR